MVDVSIEEKDGVLGYTAKEKFVKLTNWSMKVIALVGEGDAIEGAIFEHPPLGVVEDKS